MNNKIAVLHNKQQNGATQSPTLILLLTKNNTHYMEFKVSYINYILLERNDNSYSFNLIILSINSL